MLQIKFFLSKYCVTTNDKIQNPYVGTLLYETFMGFILVLKYFICFPVHNITRTVYQKEYWLVSSQVTPSTHVAHVLPQNILKKIDAETPSSPTHPGGWKKKCSQEVLRNRKYPSYSILGISPEPPLFSSSRRSGDDYRKKCRTNLGNFKVT